MRLAVWTVALALCLAVWYGVIKGLLYLAQPREPERVVMYVTMPCHKPWMSARDERAVCAMEDAMRAWAAANPGKVKR
jgi:hypothetical protein